MRKISFALTALLMSTLTAHADSLVTTRPAGTDSINWSQFGAPMTQINSGSSFTTTDGASGIITYGSSENGYVMSSGQWGGNFAPGDTRNYVGGNRSLTLTFAQGYDQIGTQIQAQGWQGFTAQICDIDGCFTEDGVSNGNGDGSAIYLGISGSNIKWVTISATENGEADGFAINQVTLDPTPTPEPSSLLLIGTGILGMASVLRRKFAR